MQPIRDYMERLVKLSDEEWEGFAGKLTRLEVKKKDFLTREGQTCDFIGFIQTGIFRFYHIQEGNEIITTFFFPMDFFSEYRSFLTGAPSHHYVQALEDSSIWVIKKKDLHDLYDEHKSFERVGRLIAENLFLGVTQRLDSFMHQTPEQRYMDLVNRNADMLQRIPQYHIAAYLGVSPETLSRIRKRVFS